MRMGVNLFFESCWGAVCEEQAFPEYKITPTPRTLQMSCIQHHVGSRQKPESGTQVCAQDFCTPSAPCLIMVFSAAQISHHGNGHEIFAGPHVLRPCTIPNATCSSLRERKPELAQPRHEICSGESLAIEKPWSH